MPIPFLSRLQALTSAAPSPADAALRARATGIVESLRRELPELLAVAVIDLGQANTLAAYSSVRELVPAKAAAHNVEVVRLKRRALEALQLPTERIEDILITLREQLHVLRVSQDGQLLLYLVVSSHDTNLAIARAVLQEHSN